MEDNTRTDAEMWEQIRRDNMPAYEEIYRKYMPVIFATVFKHIDIREDAEDLTQDVFLSIWERRATIQLEGKLFSFLYATARYKVFRYLRDKKRTVLHEAGWKDWVGAPETGGVSPSAEGQEDELDSKLEKVSAEAGRLPAQMHRIYELNMVQQIHPSEIARQLDISEHTVKKHLSNIRKRLRDAVVSLLFSLLFCWWLWLR